MYIYESAFKDFRFGYASAVSVTLVFVIVALTLIQFRVAKLWMHDG
jgi:multiple sugar transport system permease protein